MMALRLSVLCLLWVVFSPCFAASPWAGQAAAGKTKIGVCAACHGLDGKAVAPIYPSLAGQHEAYIVEQLQDFKLGRRENPIMAAMTAALSLQDMHDIGAYFAAQPVANPAAPVVPASRQTAQLAARLYQGGDRQRAIPACIACHGAHAEGNPGSGYPRLQAQSALYLSSRLKAWQAADPQHGSADARIMQTIASRLSASDIQALADYLQQLTVPGSP